MNSNGYAASSYNITFSVTEAHSGMAAYAWSGSSSSYSWTTCTSNTFTCTAAYGQTMYLFLKDQAGNVSSSKSFCLSGTAVALSTETSSYVLYPKLQKAVDGTTSGSITLLKDTVENVTNSRGSSKTITISLGTHSVTATSGTVFTNKNSSITTLSGSSSDNYGYIGSLQYLQVPPIVNVSGTLKCYYLSLAGGSPALEVQGGTVDVYYTNFTAPNGTAISVTGGTLKTHNKCVISSSASSTTMTVSGSANVTLNSNTTLNCPASSGYGVYMYGTATLNIAGASLLGSGTNGNDDSVVAAFGSAKINMTSGTCSSGNNTFILYVGGTATMSISGGTITQSRSNDATGAIGSRSTASTPITVTGGTIKSTVCGAIFGENTGSTNVSYNLYGGNILSTASYAIGISSETSHLINVNIGSGDSSVTYSSNKVQVISSVNYAISGKSSSYTHVNFGNGSIYTTKSTYYTNCGAYIARSNYSRKYTSNASVTVSGTTYKSLYKHYLSN